MSRPICSLRVTDFVSVIILCKLLHNRHEKGKSVSKIFELLMNTLKLIIRNYCSMDSYTYIIWIFIADSSWMQVDPQSYLNPTNTWAIYWITLIRSLCFKDTIHFGYKNTYICISFNCFFILLLLFLYFKTKISVNTTLDIKMFYFYGMIYCKNERLCNMTLF